MSPVSAASVFSILPTLSLFLSSCTTYDPRLGQHLVETDFTLVSQNVHSLVPSHDDSDWDHRKQALTQALLDTNPDIILFQEMETFQGRDESSVNLQRDWVLETVPGYRAGADALDATSFPITQPIFYRSEKFELLDQGFFFFSATPDRIYSPTWEGHYPSFTSWVLLRERSSERRLYVYNTHPEAFSTDSLDRGMKLIRDRIRDRTYPEVEVILGGDFNMFGSDSKLAVLEEVGLVRAPADASSFHFQWGLHLYPAIDHIFTTEGITWHYGGAIQKKWGGQYTSDHYPVLAALGWSK